MTEVLVINGHDYSHYVESKGVAWERNDLDAEKSGRSNLTGEMYRRKVGTKRKLSYNVINMTRTLLAQLDDDLSAEFFEVTYLDLHGEMTKTFYCSSFKATLDSVYDETTDDSTWADATFALIEK